ncbi:MAG: type II toxin-antitoxin system VapC family toxin [Spirochaetaceae bacterium]|nr:type II toxin-antitoxin system VapC family toxin [Spirochaetaceae bacterium]
MIYLLDTHTFIWTILETDRLSKKCKDIIFNKNNEICISTVSFWEISLKTRMKKFSFKNVDIKFFPQLAKNMDFNVINIQENEAISFHELPLKKDHKDPFDRMLIWQAITKNMVMISKDELFEQYKKDGLKLLW